MISSDFGDITRGPEFYTRHLLYRQNKPYHEVAKRQTVVPVEDRETQTPARASRKRWKKPAGAR